MQFIYFTTNKLFKICVPYKFEQARHKNILVVHIKKTIFFRYCTNYKNTYLRRGHNNIYMYIIIE